MNTKPDALVVDATWDAEAEVWVAESDDIPGLATEAETVDALAAKLKIMVPELIAANWPETKEDVAYQLRTYRYEIAHIAAS